MNGTTSREDSAAENAADDIIEYDPGGSEDPPQPQENEIDENEVKTIYIEFIKNYQSPTKGSVSEMNPSQQHFSASKNTKDNESISCNVKYCKSISTLNTDLAFFSVPPNIRSTKHFLDKWTQALQLEDESLPISFTICEKHFKPNHVELKKKGKTLKRFAVPCLELPSKEDPVVPYFSDVDSLEQYIKGSAESYMDMKSRSISEDSLESVNTTNMNPISAQIEIVENQKTIVKPVPISSPSSGNTYTRMFTTPIRKFKKPTNINDYLNSETCYAPEEKEEESEPTVTDDPVVITKIKRKKSMDFFLLDKNGESDLNGKYYSHFIRLLLYLMRGASKERLS